MMVIIRYLCGLKKSYIYRCRLVGIHIKRNDDSSESDTDAQKTCRRWAQPSEMAGQDGHRIPHARLPISGRRHALAKTFEARRSRHQSIGQDRQTARHRLQSRQKFTGQDDEGHRQITEE